jgi:Flp pilus assembly protein TadD
LLQTREKLADAEKSASEQSRRLRDQEKKTADLDRRLRDREAAIPVPPEIAREMEQLRARVAELQKDGAASPAPIPASPSARLPAGAKRGDVIGQARKLRDNGTVEESVAVYRGWVAAHPDDEEAGLELADLLHRAGRDPDARATLAAVIARFPKSASAQMVLGRIELDARNADEASKAFAKALALDARRVDAMKELSLLYHSRGRVVEASDLLRKALKYAPEDGEIHFNLAALMLMNKPPNYREAEKLYRKSLMLGEERDENIEKMLSQQR